MYLRFLLVVLALFSSTCIALSDEALSNDRNIPSNSFQDWQGFYAGLHVGGGGGDIVEKSGGPIEIYGAQFGAHVGYNWMFGRFLLGSELMANLQNFRKKSTPRIESNWDLDARLRAGIAFERVLFYATGGLGLINVHVRNAWTGSSDTNNHLAWTLGGGMEALLTRSISTRIDYQYSTLNSRNYHVGAANWNIDGEQQALRVGLSYHF